MAGVTVKFATGSSSESVHSEMSSVLDPALIPRLYEHVAESEPLVLRRGTADFRSRNTAVLRQGFSRRIS